jgi:N-acetylneuraminic acid mutarotase
MSLARVLIWLSFAPALQAGGPAAAFWEPLPSLPVGIAGFAATANGAGITVAGGTTWEGDQKLTLDRRWEWPFGGGGWLEREPLPRPYAHGAAGRHENRLVLAAGSDGFMMRNDVIAIPDRGRPNVIGALTEPAAYCASAVAGNMLYVLGGARDIGDLTTLGSSFHAFDLQTGSSESLPAYPGGPVMHARLAVIPNRILVFPGGTYDTTHRRAINQSAVWSYTFDKRRWTRLKDYPFAVRGLAVCTLEAGGHIFAAGGYRSTTGNDPQMTGACFVYDVMADRYDPLPPLPYAAMLMETVRDHEFVYVLGGEDRSRHRATQVFRASIAALLAAAQ